jgi:hypothetical protein
LCIGFVAVTAVESWPGRARAVQAAYGAVLVAFLAATTIGSLVGYSSPTRAFNPKPVEAAVANARCPVGDNPSILILTGLLRRILDNGCPLFVSPTGVSYDTDRNLRGKERLRPNQPEYQAIMQNYYGKADAALFIRDPSARGLTPETLAIIRAHLPVEVERGKVQIFLPASP